MQLKKHIGNLEKKEKEQHIVRRNLDERIDEYEKQISEMNSEYRSHLSQGERENQNLEEDNKELNRIIFQLKREMEGKVP